MESPEGPKEALPKRRFGVIGLDLGKLCFGSATEHIVFVRSVKVGLVTTITRS